MKTAFLFLLAAFVLARAEAAVCKGAEPCNACRDCTRCAHCSPQNAKGGSCGTLRNQDAEASARRVKKRGG